MRTGTGNEETMKEATEAEANCKGTNEGRGEANRAG